MGDTCPHTCCVMCDNDPCDQRMVCCQAMMMDCQSMCKDCDQTCKMNCCAMCQAQCQTVCSACSKADCSMQQAMAGEMRKQLITKTYL